MVVGEDEATVWAGGLEHVRGAHRVGRSDAPPHLRGLKNNNIDTIVLKYVGTEKITSVTATTTAQRWAILSVSFTNHILKFKI